jgi:PEP-CTERM motif
MLKRPTIFLAVLFGCFSFARAQGYYTTGVSLSPDITFPSGTDLVGRFEPAANIIGVGYLIYTIDSSSKLVVQSFSLGAVQPSWSIVQDGGVLDDDHYLSGVPGQSLNGYQLTLDQSFLVAMRLIDIPPTGVFPERFGWARLKYTSTGLQIVDQATALSGNGIIAGTTTVLPEPSTLSLIGVGAVGFFFARRLKSRRENRPPVE